MLNVLRGLLIFALFGLSCSGKSYKGPGFDAVPGMVRMRIIMNGEKNEDYLWFEKRFYQCFSLHHRFEILPSSSQADGSAGIYLVSISVTSGTKISAPEFERYPDPAKGVVFNGVASTRFEMTVKGTAVGLSGRDTVFEGSYRDARGFSTENAETRADLRKSCARQLAARLVDDLTGNRKRFFYDNMFKD